MVFIFLCKMYENYIGVKEREDNGFRVDFLLVD